MELEIKLEKFKENDFHYYYQLVNDKKVMEMITERPIEEDEAKADFEKIIENNKIKENLGNFKIINHETNEFIGLGKIEIKNENDKEVELGYMIIPKYWGKGIASKVGKQLIEKSKNEKQIKKIFAIIDPNNLPSRKVLTKNAFVSKEFKDFDGLPGEILELYL